MREVGDQLGGSDPTPAYINLDAITVKASTIPMWNFNKQIGRYIGTAHAS